MLPISQETCSHWGPGSIPPRVLNALTFSHTAFARLHTEVQLRQESSLYHQWARKRCQCQWERLSTYLRSRWHNERFCYVYQVNEKKEHFWNIRKPKVPLFTCSLKAKPIYPFVWSMIWLRTQTNKKRNRKVLTDECQQLFYFLCVSKNSLFYWKPHTTTTPGYAPFYSGIFWINFLLYNLSNQDSRCSHHKGPFPKLSACIEHLQKCHGHSDNRAETWRCLGTFQVSEWNVNPLKWLGNFTDILPFAPSGRAAKEKTESKPILGFQLWVIWCGNCIFL